MWTTFGSCVEWACRTEFCCCHVERTKSEVTKWGTVVEFVALSLWTVLVLGALCDMRMFQWTHASGLKSFEMTDLDLKGEGIIWLGTALCLPTCVPFSAISSKQTSSELWLLALWASNVVIYQAQHLTNFLFFMYQNTCIGLFLSMWTTTSHECMRCIMNTFVLKEGPNSNPPA